MASKPTADGRNLSGVQSPRKHKHQLTSTAPAASIPLNAMQLPISSATLFVAAPPQQYSSSARQSGPSQHPSVPSSAPKTTLSPPPFRETSAPPVAPRPIALQSSLLMSSHHAAHSAHPSSALHPAASDAASPDEAGEGREDPYASGERMFYISAPTATAQQHVNQAVAAQHRISQQPHSTFQNFSNVVPTTLPIASQKPNSHPKKQAQLSTSTRVRPSKTLTLGRTLELYSNYSRLERSLQDKETSNKAKMETDGTTPAVQHPRDMYEFWPAPDDTHSSDAKPSAPAAFPESSTSPGAGRYGGKLSGDTADAIDTLAGSKDDKAKSSIWLTSSEIMLKRSEKLHKSLHDSNEDLPEKLDSLLKMNTLHWLKNRGKGTKMATEMDRVRMLRDWFEALDVDGSGDISVDELEEPLISIGLVSSKADLIDMINKYDSSGDGEIDFQEFVKMVMTKEEGGQSNAMLKLFEAFSEGKLGDPLLPFSTLVHMYSRKQLFNAVMSDVESEREEGQQVLRARIKRSEDAEYERLQAAEKEKWLREEMERNAASNAAAANIMAGKGGGRRNSVKLGTLSKLQVARATDEVLGADTLMTPRELKLRRDSMSANARRNSDVRAEGLEFFEVRTPRAAGR